MTTALARTCSIKAERGAAIPEAKNVKRALIVLGLVATVAAGWFFVSPLFIDQEVNEQFELVLADGRVNMEGLMAMSPDKRMTMRGDIMSAAARAPDRSAAEPMPAQSPGVLASGQFVDADAVHKGSGTASLYALGNGDHLLRLENLRTTNGPALVVYLARHEAPRTASDVTEGGYLSLGKLKGNIGNQNYPVPSGTDVTQYHSVVIWCELFGVLFSPAALSANT